MKVSLFKKFTYIAVIFAVIIPQIFSVTVYAEVPRTEATVDLISPITSTSKNQTLSEEEKKELGDKVSQISQVAFDAFLMDNPQNSFWMDIKGSKTLYSVFATQAGSKYNLSVPTLKIDLPALSEYSSPKNMQQTLISAVDSFTPAGQTLYEKVKSVHDKVCELTVYDSTAKYAYSAYGVFADGRSVCEGYAEAFKLLCDRSGIECILVVGTGITAADSGPHMWNYVRMDDGAWYAVDCTWDDGKKISDRYLLVGSGTVVLESSGTRFADDHLPSGDISGTGIKDFELPALSVRSYLEKHEAGASQASGTAPSGGYYFGLLNKEQQNFYNALLTIEIPDGDTQQTTESKDEGTSESETESTTETDKKTETSTKTESQSSTQTETDKNTQTSTSQSSTSRPPETTKPITTPSDTQSTTASDTLTNGTDKGTETVKHDTADTLPQSGSDSAAYDSDGSSDTNEPNVQKKPSVAHMIKEVLSVVIVVIALITVFCFVGIVIIKLAKQEKQ